MTAWGMTVDCAEPRRLATFWALALGYVQPEPPAGFASRESWLLDLGIPEDEWEDAAYLVDPTDASRTLSFLKVPEPKAGKNRWHLDLKVTGGRQQPQERRRQLIIDTVGRLLTAGGTVLQEVGAQPSGTDGHPEVAIDHVVMADPEGNEFCVL